MRPEWFALDAIPYDQMWSDAPHWLPLVVSGQRFRAHFSFRGESTLTEHAVKVLADNQPLIEL